MRTQMDCAATTDKTQRLTIRPIEGIHSLLILQLAASVAQVSQHPFASAIVQEARRKGVGLYHIRKYKHQYGVSLSGCIEGLRVAIGRVRLKSRRKAGASELDVIATAWDNKGQTVAYVLVEGRLAGIIGVAYAAENQAHNG